MYTIAIGKGKEFEMMCEARFWNDRYECEETATITIIDTPLGNVYHMFCLETVGCYSRDFDTLADVMAAFADHVAAWEGREGHIMQVGE